MKTSDTHQPFGNTGLRLPRVVFGATCLGNLFVAMSDAEKHDLIREWFRLMPEPVAIDSAGKYGAGLSLEVLGRELSALGIAPSDVVISNKLAWRRVPLTAPEPTFEPGVWINIDRDAVQDISYDGILRCYDDGCEMLGDYPPQLVSVHDPDEYLAAATDNDDRKQRLDDIIGAYQALTELRDAGIAAGVGVGSKTWRVIQELDEHCDFDWVMFANSFTIMHHPPELIALIDSLASRNIAVINSAVTHGGFLTGGRFCDYREIDLANAKDAAKLRWRERYTELCRQHDDSPYDVAVAFGGSHPGVTSIALSTSRPERTEAMIAAGSKKLTPDLWSALRAEGLIADDYPYAS